jgi:RHS repeat-associated protein
MKAHFYIWHVLALGMLSSLFAAAQEPFDVQKGLTPYGSYKGGDIDTVNMMNGNVAVHIPLISFPGRGKFQSLNSGYIIHNNDKQFTFSYIMAGATVQGQWALFGGSCPVNYGGCDPGAAQAHVGTFITGDGGYSTQTLTTYITGNCVQYPAQSPCTNPVQNFYLLGPDDSRHYLGNYAASSNSQTPANCANTAIDYSGYVGLLTGGPNAYTCFGSILDRNGNYSNADIDGNIGGATDTVGRSYPPLTSVAPSSTPCSSGTTSASVWNLPGSSSYYVCYTTLSYSTSFNAHSLNTCLYWASDQEASGTQIMMTEIVLPNSTRYKFSYDSYLSLTQVTLPTGGYISYTWQNVVLNCPSKSSPVSRVLASRSFFDGVSGGGATYQWIPIVNQGGTVGVTVWDHVVTDSMGNSEVHSISVGGGNAQENEVDYYSGCAPVISGCNGRLLKKVTTTYQSMVNNADILNMTAQEGMSVNSIPLARTTVLAGSGPSSSWMTSKTVYTPVLNLATQTAYVWPADKSQPARPINVTLNTGQIATVDDYDFGPGAAGAKIRSTTTTYQWQGNPTYLAANLIDLPASVVVTDGSGNKCSETDYTYDEPGYITQFTGTTIQFNPQPLNKIRGNASTVSRWLSSTPCQSGATGSFIQTHTNMYDTGEDYQDYDADGHPPTTHSYDSAYYGAYRTKTQMPDTGTVHHVVAGAYDLNTGLITTFSGQNAYTGYGAPETTTYAWDLNMRRIVSAAFPDGGLTTFCYSDSGGVGGPNCSQTSAPYQLTMQQNQTTLTPSITKLVLFDKLGRTKQTQLTSDPLGTDFTDTAYDAKGRVASVSNPHRTAASSTDGTTYTQYDGLSRPLQIIKQDGSRVQTSYADAGASCGGQPCAANTTCVTVTDEAGKVRTTCSDALGRLIEVDEPGASGATVGTTATASVTIAGGPDQSATFNPCQNNPPPAPNYCPYTINDSGNLWVSGSDYNASTSFGPGTTTSAITSALVSAINTGSSTVTATASGNVITITSKATGTAANYSIGTGTTWQNQTFSHPSFTVCINGATCTSGTSSGSLTGGTDSSVGTSPLVTLYKYDTLGNLLCVEQHGTATSGTGCSSYPNAFSSTNPYRVRQFFYDSFSRLTKAQNPESGTINYAYDNNGNLLTKTDARGVVTTYTYDAINRLTGKTYSSGDHAVTYTYDTFVNNAQCGSTGNFGIGRRTGMTDASGSSSWTYDLMGRVWKETHTIGSVTNTIGNCYNYDGSIKQITYPSGSGSVVSYGYDAAAHLTSVTDTAHSITYMQASAFYPPGELNQATYGVTSAITETNIFNNRLQPCWYFATTVSPLLSTKLCTDSVSPASILDLKYNYTATGLNDNGNVMALTNNKDSNRSVNYAYDPLNRIASAATPNTDCSLVTGTSLTKNWGESTTIDAWGNLSARTVTKCSADGLSVGIQPNNQLTSFGYDASGNMTSNGGANYTYNGESQLATAGGATYTYDGDGNRVKKSSGTLYWGSGPLVESDLNGTASSLKEYIMAGGRRIARRDNAGAGSIFFYLSDNLGSSREIVQSGQTSACYDADFYPYGGERAYINTCPQNYKFTGKERDSESGLDNFKARFDSSNLGRFMSADPIAIMRQKLVDPQQLNMYAYVRNNPLSMIDPTGMFTWFAMCNEKQDKVCHQNREEFREDLRMLEYAARSYKKGSPERTRLERALATIGKEGKGGPSVGFASLEGSSNAKTSTDGKAITLDMSKDAMKTPQYQAGIVAEEGTHAADDQDSRRATLSPFSFEYRGHESLAWTIQGLSAKGSFTTLTQAGNVVTLYDQSWKERQREVATDKAATTQVVDDYGKGYEETTPHDPWGD